MDARRDRTGFDAEQLRILERVATGAPLGEVLARIVALIEAQSETMLCSILLLDRANGCLRPGAAPSLPPDFVRALDGARIGPHAGSCGAAAHQGRRMVAEDIATHPDWVGYRALALPFGLRACWSTPIFGPAREVLGTFAMYYRESRGPTDREIGWVETATHLASIAIVRHEAEAEQRRSHEVQRELAEHLGERVKELTLLHEAARRLQAHARFDAELLRELVELLAVAFRHPEVCEARIAAEGVEACTPGFVRSEWMLAVPIDVEAPAGVVEVVYREPRPERGHGPFMREELLLMRSLAGMLATRIVRQRAEDLVRAGDERLRGAFEHTPHVAVQWYDADARVLSYNRASRELYGWSEHSAIGKTLEALGFPGGSTFATLLRSVVETGAPAGPVELAVRRMDGTEGIVLSTVFRIPLGAGGACYACMDLDLTAHRRAEQALHAAERAKAFVFANAVDCFFSIACEPAGVFRFVSVNPAFLAATGLAESQVVGRRVDEVVPSASLAQVLEHYAEAIATRRPVSWDEVSVYPAGVKHGEVTVAPMFDPDGRCTHLIGTVHDVTARRQAEEQRRALQRELHQVQRLQALGTLAAGVAHDFNNSLTAILGNVELARMRLPADSPVREHLAEIAGACQRAASLIQQLHATGRQPPPPSDLVDAREALEEARRTLRAALPAQVVLRVSVADDAPPVAGDATQLHRMLVNLGTNAAHAMSSAGGTIELVADAHVVVGGAGGPAAGTYLRIRVVDDGRGMDDATRARVFEPFFTTKPAGKGTGLGLAVVHGVVSRHGGSITVESKLGRGTTFTILLPVAASAAIPAEPSHGAAAGTRVLYVDDDDALVLLAGRALQQHGYRVSGHVDPLAALAEFRAHPHDHDLAVIDISMPMLSGTALARELLAIRPELPIVLTSGYLKQEDLEDAKALGIVEIVLKPSSMQELERVLERSLRRRRSR